MVRVAIPPAMPPGGVLVPPGGLPAGRVSLYPLMAWCVSWPSCGPPGWLPEGAARRNLENCRGRVGAGASTLDAL